jgi:hypothetical protein
MAPQERAGHVVGVLLLLHLIGGLILPYVLLDAAIGPPSVLASVAAHGANLRAAVSLFLLGAALVLAIAIALWPVFRAYSEGLATAFLALAVANVSLQLVESGTLLTILSLSQQLASANPGDTALLQAVGAAAATARRWAHYTQLLTVVSWLFLLYLILWRSALVPRPIAAAGIVTTLLQITGVPGRAILGYAPIMQLAMPLAPVHVTLALWLALKGWRRA